MDIDLSKEDLAFRDEVRSFFEDSKIKDGEDYFSWREGWFKKAREKEAGTCLNGQQNLVDPAGHLLSIIFGSKKQLKQIYPLISFWIGDVGSNTHELRN